MQKLIWYLYGYSYKIPKKVFALSVKVYMLSNQTINEHKVPYFVKEGDFITDFLYFLFSWCNVDTKASTSAQVL